MLKIDEKKTILTPDKRFCKDKRHNSFIGKNEEQNDLSVLTSNPREEEGNSEILVPDGDKETVNNLSTERKQKNDDDQGISEKSIAIEEMNEEDFYHRYSPAKKHLFVFISSVSCLMSPMSSLAFLPAVSEIADRFNTTPTIINISNAIYCLIMAISPCVFGPIGDIYGRRFTFNVCLFLYSISTVLVAVSQNLAMFYIFRMLSSLFGTAFFSTAASVVSDIYTPVERSTAMGWSLAGTQIGSAFGPFLGGVIVNYTSWRVIFWMLAGLGFFVFALAFFFLPETAKHLKYRDLRNETGKRFIFIPYNPFKVILALKHKKLMLAGVMSSSIHYNMYSLLTPIRYVINPRFNLNSPIYAGLFYLPPGLGYLCGSFFGGKWADHITKRYIKKRGRRIPEDRLRSLLIGYGFFLPGSILVYGWSLKFEKGGMALPIIVMFICGFAQIVCYPSLNTYCIDCVPNLHGDGVASNYMIRFVAAAIASATCLTEIQKIGIGWTCTISALYLWFGFFCSLFLIRFSEKL